MTPSRVSSCTRPMTIREKLTRQKRIADILSIGGIGGVVLFCLLANLVDVWFVLPGILCALAAPFSMAYRHYTLRCPECGVRLRRVTSSQTNSVAAPHDFICCPLCQVSFDAEISGVRPD